MSERELTLRDTMAADIASAGLEAAYATMTIRAMGMDMFLNEDVDWMTDTIGFLDELRLILVAFVEGEEVP